MERYGYICGTDSMGEYGQIAVSDGIRDFVQKTGTPFPMEALERVQSLMRGYEQLPGWEEQPQKEKPVAVRYSCLSMAGKYQMPEDMKPVYALSVSGVELRLGYKKYAYDALVLLDRRELISKTGMNYMDLIFGTHLLGAQEIAALRQGRENLDPALKPVKVSPRIKKEDLPAVMAVLNGLFEGKTVILRLEKGYVFNQRAFEVLEQVYSLMPPKTAIGTGFATYLEAKDVKGIQELGIRLLAVPGELEEFQCPAGCVMVDLAQTLQPQSSNLNKCITRWSRLEWEERYEAMSKVFADDQGWDPENYVQKTVKFFSDPIFKYRPASGKCSTLEELKAEHDRFPALAMDISWLREKFRKAVPVLLGQEGALLAMKAEAAALARTALTPEERKKYTALYRFAQKIDPGDASLHAIVSTEEAVEARFDAQKQDLLRQQEQKLKAEAELARAQALEKQKAEFEAKLAAREKELQEKLKKELAAKDQAAKTAQQTARKNLDQVTAELQKLKSDHAAQTKKQNEAHTSEIQKLNRAHAEEVQKLKSAQAEEVKTLKAAQSAELQKLNTAHAEALRKAKAGQAIAAAAGAGSEELKKQITDLTVAHQAEIQKLKEAQAREIQSLKEAHARALAARPAPSARGNAAQEVSSKAKQLLAAQLMGNMARIEELKRVHQEELENLRSGSQS